MYGVEEQIGSANVIDDPGAWCRYVHGEAVQPSRFRERTASKMSTIGDPSSKCSRDGQTQSLGSA